MQPSQEATLRMAPHTT